jgi:PhoPQ-activated pathogenicity-related protein
MIRSTAIKISIALAMTLALAPGAAADLAGYVKADDQGYRWEKSPGMDSPEGVTVHELRLISQIWQGIAWQHRLRIITPHVAQQMPSLALLIISDSGSGAQELREGIFMARELRAPVAILHDIPNQPLFGGLLEDDLLAYTFVRFLKTRDGTWPLLLPMVKAAVKAMDAIQEFMQRELQAHVSGFLVSGASKRGWTTWLTPVVDARVKAIAPLVYDNLNLSEQMRHQRETWGHFSGQIAAYTEQSLPQLLLAQDPGAVALASMVDPFVYRQQITVPKLIILGTNDRYWPLDALNLYYHALLGERYVLYVANAGHNLQPGRERATAGLMALFQATAGRLRLPTLRWEANAAGDTLSLALSSTPTPQTVRAWTATSPTRDFREATWEAFAMRQEQQHYAYTRSRRAGEMVAIFGEAVYTGESGTFSLSTTVTIFP